MGTYALFPQLVVTDSNKYIDVDIGGGEVNVTVATGTYDDIRDLAGAVETALDGVDASFDCVVGSDGKVTISRTGNFAIMWSTGTNGSGGLGLHIGDLLGFDDTANDAGSDSYESDNVSQGAWIPDDNPSADSYDRPQFMGPPTFRAQSGRTSRTTTGEHTVRDLEWNAIPIANFLRDESAEAGTFEDFWRQVMSGRTFRLYTDRTDYASTDQGQYGVEAGADEAMRNRRMSPGNAYYPARLNLVAQP
jgi:hypothetical protein